MNVNALALALGNRMAARYDSAFASLVSAARRDSTTLWMASRACAAEVRAHWLGGREQGPASRRHHHPLRGSRQTRSRASGPQSFWRSSCRIFETTFSDCFHRTRSPPSSPRHPAAPTVTLVLREEPFGRNVSLSLADDACCCRAHQPSEPALHSMEVRAPRRLAWANLLVMLTRTIISN